MKKRQVRAPSNIAFIKYMGKSDTQKNLPENASLSMTLDRLCTFVDLEATPASGPRSIEFLPEAPQVKAELALSVPDLSKSGREKVIHHLERVERLIPELFSKFNLEVENTPLHLKLRSANTFPEASGIASSASSFAAITLAMASVCAKDEAAFSQVFSSSILFKEALAAISRQGSGSSCRSFAGPFVRWSGEATEIVAQHLPELHHFVILFDEAKKTVSSSEAHARVKTSPLWTNRVSRVEARLVSVQTALAKGDLKSVSTLTWQEAWEMHSLFHTSLEPFTYWKPGTMDALNWISPYVQTSEHPPIVTLDAGPNLHVTVLKKEASLWRERLQARFPVNRFLEDQPGLGARFV